MSTGITTSLSRLDVPLGPTRTPPSAYWEARARQFARRGWGLRAVCSYGMPSFYNGYIHLLQSTALAPWLAVAAGTTVLEVGCGVGRWSRRLAGSGADVTGIDLAPAMVAEAVRRAAGEGSSSRCTYLVHDVVDLALPRRFDRVFSITVLQHIVDSTRMQRALDRMSAHLAPGGRIVLLEAAPSMPTTRCDTATFVARAESTYLQAFERAGLRCLATTGVDPVPFKTWLLPFYRRLPRAFSLASLFAVTAVTLPVDLALGRRLIRASWHKVFVLGAEA